MENYERIEKIATGKSGSFWKARAKDTDQIVVIKEEKLQKKKFFKIFKYPELRLLGVCRNTNLVQYIQLIKEYENLYIVLQYCEKNLQSEIESRQSNPFIEDEIRYILTEVSKGLKDIHDNKYVHRDICPKNIFITPNHVVLGDFSNILCLRDKTECEYHGNTNYSSPEVNKDPSSADYKSDIFSLGCLLLELVSPKEFQSNISKIKESNESDINWDDITLPSDISSDLLALIKIMLEKNIEQRISLDNVISHSFLRDGELKNIYNDNNSNNDRKYNNDNNLNNDLSPSLDNNDNNNMRNLDDSLESSIDDEIPTDTDDENINNPLLHLSFDKMNTKSLYEEIAYRSSEEEEFNEDEIRWFLKEMIKELSKFHKENYVIRDISPKQLYFLSSELKIGVFHNAVNTQKDSFPLKTPTSTYTAPEIINNLSYSNCSSDLFSVGCIMLELYNPGSYKMNIKVIETANNDEAISWNLVKLPSSISDEAVEILKGLLNMEIENRMTLDELSNHPFLSKDTNPISPESRSLRRVSSHIGSLLSLTHVATVESIEPSADHEVKATPRRYMQTDKEESNEKPKLEIEEKDGLEDENDSELDFDDESFATKDESKDNHSQIVPSLNIQPEENKEKEENKMKPNDDEDIENSSEEDDEEGEEEEDDDDEDDEEEDEDEEEGSSSSEEKKKKKSKKGKKTKKSKAKKDDIENNEKKDDDDDDDDENMEGGMKPPEDDSDSDDLENSEDDKSDEDNGDNRNKSSEDDDNSNSDANKKKDEEKTKKKNDIDEQIDEDDEEYDNFEEDDEERDEVADTVAEPTLPPELAGATTDLTTIDENAEEPQMLLPLNPNLTAQPKRKLRKATPSPQQLIAEANSTVIEGPSTFLKELPLNEMDEEDESIINEESEENYEGESI